MVVGVTIEIGMEGGKCCIASATGSPIVTNVIHVHVLDPIRVQMKGRSSLTLDWTHRLLW